MRRFIAALVVALALTVFPVGTPVGAGTEYRMSALLRRIGGCESSGHPNGRLRWHILNDHGQSTSSGAFQIVVGTWDGYGGYREARHAPPSVQIAKANLLLASRMGKAHWNASRRCWD